MRARDQSSIFSTGGKFRPDYGLLLELHALTLVAHSYALLTELIPSSPTRYATRSCPLCEIQVAEAEASMRMIIEQINALSMGSGSGSGGGNGSRSRDLGFLNREEEFGHLIMVGK